eukprot:gene7774-biopygen16582
MSAWRCAQEVLVDLSELNSDAPPLSTPTRLPAARRLARDLARRRRHCAVCERPPRSRGHTPQRCVGSASGPRPLPFLPGLPRQLPADAGGAQRGPHGQPPKMETTGSGPRLGILAGNMGAPPIMRRYGRGAPPIMRRYGRSAPPIMRRYGRGAPPIMRRYGRGAPPIMRRYGRGAPPIMR